MAALITVSAGTLVTITATFESETGTATDPTTITLKYAQGRASYPVTTWVYQGAGSITRDGTGVYVAELDTTGLPGTWVGEWIGTGACQVTQSFSFLVQPLPL